jgi:uncharacterized membrane protein YdjX (TVP38/TMEM64 family)
MAVLVALVVGLAVGAALLPLHQIPDAVQDLGAWGPPAAAALGALLLAALVPRTAISIACGALFGAVGGGFTALTAAMVAAVVTFEIGRRLGRDEIAAHVGDRLARLDGWLARKGMFGVFVVRLLPIAPFGLLGYAYGTTGVRRRDHVVGTLAAATPSAFTYAAVGAAVVRPGAIRLVTFLPAAVGLLVTVAATVYWVRTGRHGPPTGAEATEPQDPPDAS